MPISSVTDVRIVALVRTVMPFFLTNESRCFLYMFVLINQSCSFCDELAKKNTVSANGQEAPESLKNWRAAAENAGKAQSVYEAARRGVEQLISDMESGAVDVSTEQGVKSYNAVMAEYSAATEKLSQAARENVNARDT